MGKRKSSIEYVKSLPHSFLNDGEWGKIIGVLGLSPMQARIAALIIEGKRDKQIARALGIGISTVRTHLDRIFARLGVADRMELVGCIFATYRRECGRPARRPRIRGHW